MFVGTTLDSGQRVSVLSVLDSQTKSRSVGDTEGLEYRPEYPYSRTSYGVDSVGKPGGYIALKRSLPAIITGFGQQGVI